MRVLSADELRRMRVVTPDIPAQQVATPLVTNSSLSTTVAARPTTINERGWAVVERAGAQALGRRHPLTIEGEDVGRFDVVFSCGDTSDSFAVTYLERRRGRDPQHAAAPLKQVSVLIGHRTVPLEISSSEAADKTGELVSLARGSVPAALMTAFANNGNARSLTVRTAGGEDPETAIRIGNTGVAQSLAQLAGSCIRKTAAVQ
jgi:hypothetical protein